MRNGTGERKMENRPGRGRVLVALSHSPSQEDKHRRRCRQRALPRGRSWRTDHPRQARARTRRRTAPRRARKREGGGARGAGTGPRYPPMISHCEYTLLPRAVRVLLNPPPPPMESLRGSQEHECRGVVPCPFQLGRAPAARAHEIATFGVGRARPNSARCLHFVDAVPARRQPARGRRVRKSLLRELRLDELLDVHAVFHLGDLARL